MQIWVAEPSRREDLCTLVLAYLQGSVPHPPIDNAVNFYQAAKSAAVSLCVAMQPCQNKHACMHACMQLSGLHWQDVTERHLMLHARQLDAAFQGHSDTTPAVSQIQECRRIRLLSLKITVPRVLPPPLFSSHRLLLNIPNAVPAALAL